MEHEMNRVTHYDLNEMTIEYVAHLSGDTPDDDKRREQILHLEDDIESLNDAEHYENHDVEMDDENIPEQLRQRQAQDRKLRRAK
eukprot:1027438-Amphidinium_carterae.1